MAFLRFSIVSGESKLPPRGWIDQLYGKHQVMRG